VNKRVFFLLAATSLMVACSANTSDGSDDSHETSQSGADAKVANPASATWGVSPESSMWSATPNVKPDNDGWPGLGPSNTAHQDGTINGDGTNPPPPR